MEGQCLLVAAVADGAGSAPLAEVGAVVSSRAAVESACAQLAAGLVPDDEDGWHGLLSLTCSDARAAVEQEAARRSVSPRDLASTLIVVVAAPGLVAAAQVGDGAAVAADPAGGLTALTAPDTGEYLNETTFLISPGALEGLQLRLWRGDVAHVALFSDGLEMLALKMPEGTPHGPFFAPLFRFVGGMADTEAAGTELAAFLGSARVRQRTDDDVTLLLAARTDAGAICL